MGDWVTDIVSQLGYIGVALLMFLENVFPPIPSELIMPLAGFAAARGDLTFIGAIVAGTVGSVLGQFPLYYLGHKLGEQRLRAWVDRYGRWLTVTGDDIDRASRWFSRHGHWTVLLCRLVPGVRSYISIPAGIDGMNLLAFTAYSTLGMGVWATALAAAGYLLGHQYDAVAEYLGPASTVVFVLIVLALVVWIGLRYYRCWRS